MGKSIILKYWITSHVGHSLSLPAAMPPAVGEGGGVRKGPPIFNYNFLC
jgi:hypothetical protein